VENKNLINKNLNSNDSYDTELLDLNKTTPEQLSNKLYDLSIIDDKTKEKNNIQDIKKLYIDSLGKTDSKNNDSIKKYLNKIEQSYQSIFDKENFDNTEIIKSKLILDFNNKLSDYNINIKQSQIDSIFQTNKNKVKLPSEIYTYKECENCSFDNWNELCNQIILDVGSRISRNLLIDEINRIFEMIKTKYEKEQESSRRFDEETFFKKFISSNIVERDKNHQGWYNEPIIMIGKFENNIPMNGTFRFVTNKIWGRITQTSKFLNEISKELNNIVDLNKKQSISNISQTHIDNFNDENRDKLIQLINNKYFNNMNLCKNLNNKLINHYHVFIQDKINDKLQNGNTTDYIFIDHLLYKTYLYYYLEYYTFINNKKNKIENDRKKLLKDIRGLSGFDALKSKFFDDNFVIKKLKEYLLKHRISDIYKYNNKDLSVKSVIKYDDRSKNGKFFRLNLTKSLKFTEDESKKFELCIKDIYDYYLDKLKKEKEKKDGNKKDDKTKKKLANLDSKHESEKKKITGDLKDSIKKTEKTKDGLDEKLKMIEKLKQIQNDQNEKLKGIISKYEKESIENDRKIKELQRLYEITQKNSKELVNTINKSKGARREISVKTRELLIDRLKQIKRKKKIEEEAIEELTLTNEKLKLSIVQFKENSKKKEEELREIEKIKTELLETSRIMELNRLKMALTESSLRRKEKKMEVRDKTIRENLKQLNDKTLKKKIPISFDPQYRKTKKKVKKKVDRKTKSKI